MKLKDIIDTDISNYKKISMFLITNTCSLKCDKENGNSYCQNSGLLSFPDIEISGEEIYERFCHNQLSESVVVGGLEPFDSIDDLIELLRTFRKIHRSFNDIVIYTGYYREEIADKLALLDEYRPFTVKFGRYRPNDKEHFDPVLGVNLASDGQHAEIFYR